MSLTYKKKKEERKIKPINERYEEAKNTLCRETKTIET